MSYNYDVPDIPEHYKILDVDFYPSTITGQYVDYIVLAWDTKMRRLVERTCREIRSVWTPSLAQLATSEEVDLAALCKPESWDAQKWIREVAAWKEYLDTQYQKNGRSDAQA